MAMKRPTFKVNTAASRKSTVRKSVFYDIKPDTSVRMRVLPPVNEDGNIFTKVTNHFRLKNEDNFGIALACLEEHGNEELGTECYLCEVYRMLRDSDDKQVKKIASDIRPSPRWYIQAFIWDKDDNTYFGPKLVGVSKTTADALNALLTSQEESGDDFFCDVDNGQDLTIRRDGSGLKSKYTVLPSGKKISLDEAIPGWEDKIIVDIPAAIEQRIEDMDGQKRALHRTFDDELPWDEIQEKLG